MFNCKYKIFYSYSRYLDFDGIDPDVIFLSLSSFFFLQIHEELIIKAEELEQVKKTNEELEAKLAEAVLDLVSVSHCFHIHRFCNRCKLSISVKVLFQFILYFAFSDTDKR